MNGIDANGGDVVGKAPAFQFYAADFLQGTSDFSLEERGAYITLLAMSWDKGPLSLDEHRRANMLGVSRSRFRRIWAVIGQKWARTDDGYVNRRLEEVRAKQEAYSQAQADRGRASAVARASTKREPEGNRRSTGATTGSQPAEPNGNSSVFDLQSSKTDPRKEREDLRAREFERFYARYPKRRVNRPDAEKAWKTLDPDASTIALIHTALDWQLQSRDWTKDEGEFIPGAGPYLRGRKWEAEPPVSQRARMVAPKIAADVRALCDTARIRTFEVESWFGGVTLERDSAGAVTLRVPDAERGDYIRKHYLESLQQAAERGGAVSLKVAA